MAFSNEQLAYASGALLSEFGAEMGLSRDGDSDADFRARIQRVAFPVADVLSSSMTLRDYFAAKAMASLTTVYWEDFEVHGSGAELVKSQAGTAYEMADAMLAERAK